MSVPVHACTNPRMHRRLERALGALAALVLIAAWDAALRLDELVTPAQGWSSHRAVIANG